MMDTFPDLGSLSDQELKDLIQQLTEEEVEISYKRRILHGKIDILRAELVNRLRKKHEGGEDVITGADVQRLTDILAGRGAGTRLELSAARRRARGAALPRMRLRQRRGSQLLPAVRCVPGRAEGARRRAARRPTASARPASSCRSSSSDVVAHGRGARDPLRRRPRRRELRDRRRAHDHRPPPRLRRVPRRRHRLARPRAARRRGGDWYLDDCGSLNGTYVNRTRIESHRLEDGDELQIGKYKLTFLAR